MQSELFTTLPGELRNKIYDLVLPKNETQVRTVRRRVVRPYRFAKDLPIPGIFAVSHQIREETLQLYFKNNKQIILARTCEISIVAEWLSLVSYAKPPSAFQGQVEVQITDVLWSTLHRVYPLIETIRALGLANEQLNIASLTMRMTSALKEAVNLGHRAKSCNWSEDKLKEEFERWLDEVKLSVGIR